MRVTYLGHSGFFVEMEKVCLLFDYYRGELPDNLSEERKRLQDKKWYVFASHSHGDHFNPKVFEVMDDFADVTYIFSADIKRKLRNDAGRMEQLEKEGREILFIKYHEEMVLKDLIVRTFHSTDIGVAFLVKAEGKLLYHAGDLNWWHWEGETKQYNNNMAARYKDEVEKIKEQVKELAGDKKESLEEVSMMESAALDVAFLPLDPRLENAYYMGMKYFLEKVGVKVVFPMHFWDKLQVQDKFLQEYGDVLAETGCDFCRIHNDGEVFVLEGE